MTIEKNDGEKNSKIQKIDIDLEDEDQVENELDNYFKIIKFEDRINKNHSILRKTKNLLIKMFFVCMCYYFACKFSGYRVFLVAANSGIKVQNFQFLTGLLVLAILTNLWGIIPGVLGGVMGDLIYQYATNNLVLIDYTILIGVIALFSGIYKYNKDETIPNLKIMKFFYILFLGFAVSCFIYLITILVIYPNLSWDTLIGLTFRQNLIQFLISEIISFIFIAPLMVVLIDRILKKGANKYSIIYHPLLTHHVEFESDHAIPLKIDGYYVFFCTRCTGMFTGILIGLFIHTFLLHAFRFEIPPDIVFIIIVILPIPGLIDWGTQKLLMRTSNDYLRILTGICIGIALHLITLLETAELRLFVLLFIYFSIFGLLMYLGNKRSIY
ncbi:MAG: DUF2085 domain-containing protein [Candidatus Lokiarchaeota archaeon]|nr:DUF2085 domain-containing protein [Candidatus Lokiarchaeota archaeon]